MKNVHVAAVNTLPVVAFAAANTSTGGAHEILLFTQVASDVTRLTNNNGDQNEPLIATMGVKRALPAPPFVCFRTSVVQRWRGPPEKFMCLHSDRYAHPLLLEPAYQSPYNAIHRVTDALQPPWARPAGQAVGLKTQ